MALTATLQPRQSQSLVMTPQLMQSIRLLQLTHVELMQYVDAEVEKNPLLERVVEDAPAGSADDAPEEPVNVQSPDDSNNTDWFENDLGHSGSEISARLDAAPEDVFPEDAGTPVLNAPELAINWKSMPGGGGQSSDALHDMDGFAERPQTLRDHVSEQIAFAFVQADERIIAADIADHLDPAGYLQMDVEEVAVRLNTTHSTIERILSALQEFEPAGLFARSLSECLAIQLRRKNRYDPAMRSLVDHLDLLARRDFKTLKKLCGVDETDLLDMLAEIRALDPKPGNRFDGANVQTIVADVTVRPAPKQTWTVELNAETLPRVLVSETYFAHVSSTTADGTDDRAYLNECMRDANWLTRSLDQRARTILKVSSEIVTRQSQFLQNGVSHLRPLTLKAVADAIGMHESTISRVTSNKYMATPRGIFELKFFFTASIASTDNGDEHSSEAVRHRIREMINAESPQKVLSDDVIVGQLKDDGIEIARRTVAKYREAMNIASSVQRRREKKALARAGQ